MMDGAASSDSQSDTHFPVDFLAALDAATLACDGKPEQSEVRFRCPAPDHPDAHPSARWNRQKATWCCDACHAGGGALDLADRLGVPRPSRPRGGYLRRKGGKSCGLLVSAAQPRNGPDQGQTTRAT